MGFNEIQLSQNHEGIGEIFWCFCLTWESFNSFALFFVYVHNSKEEKEGRKDLRKEGSNKLRKEGREIKEKRKKDKTTKNGYKLFKERAKPPGSSP